MKAALERFDAFLKSKSTSDPSESNIQTTLPPTTNLISPYLTRKQNATTQPTEEKRRPAQLTGSPSPNLSSFIRRRQARIEPSILSSKPGGASNSIYDRSMSETRSSSNLSSDQNAHPTEPGLSSLAKRYLGNLNTTMPEVSYSDLPAASISPPPPPAPASKPPSPPKQTSPPKLQPPIGKEQQASTLTLKQRSTSIGASLLNHNQTNSGANGGEKTTTSSVSSSSRVNAANNNHQSSQLNSSASSGGTGGVSSSNSSSASSSPRQLEVINSAKSKLAKSASNGSDKSSSSGVNKPPLPSNGSSATAATAAAANIIPSGLAPNTWRSKLKSVQQQQQMSGSESASDYNQSSSEIEYQPSKNSRDNDNVVITRPISSKVPSRIIPIEVKNSKLSHSKSTNAGGGSSNGGGGVLVQRSSSTLGATSTNSALNRAERFTGSSQPAATNSNKVRNFYFC